jgi:hypothetical protein
MREFRWVMGGSSFDNVKAARTEREVERDDAEERRSSPKVR